MISKDCTCDSDFMMSVVRDIDTVIRKSFYKTKKEYTRTLKEEINVQVEWQIANSPELNMLDLGGWMAIQSEVEEIHKNCTM